MEVGGREHRSSVYFIQRRTKLKTDEVLVKPTFKQSERVTDWSSLTMRCLTSH